MVWRYNTPGQQLFGALLGVLAAKAHGEISGGQLLAEVE